MKFDDKARIVAECWRDTKNLDNWANFNKDFPTGLVLAHCYVSGSVTGLTDNGEYLINLTYTAILATLNVPEKDYASFEDIIDQHLDG